MAEPRTRRCAWRQRLPEGLIVLIAIGLRLTMLTRFDPSWSYDADEHWATIQWWATHGEIPPCAQTLEAYHPPLYYALAGALVRRGADIQAIQQLSVLAGCLRILVVWLGLELYLPSRRLARLVALALLAVLPASILVDGMIGAESFNGLFAALSLLVLPRIARARGWRRLAFAAALGAILAVTFYLKISALILFGAVAAALVLDGAWHRRRCAAWAVALGIATLLVAPYLAYNRRVTGKWVLASFDCRQSNLGASLAQVPYWRRRTADYYLGWTDEIRKRPLYPVGVHPVARFWPVELASTFDDYYCYGYAPHPKPGAPAQMCNGRPIPRRTVGRARLGLHGGLIVAAVTVAAWLGALVALVRRRDTARLALLLVPLGALVGQLHFATAYPFDDEGIIKGTYLQFAAPPLFALFGVGVAWLWERRRARWVAGIALGALAFVAAYTLLSRLAG